MANENFSTNLRTACNEKISVAHVCRKMDAVINILQNGMSFQTIIMSESLVAPEANVARAKEYLDASGLSGNVRVTLDILNKAANVTTAQVIQANLAQVGITLDINLHESGAFWSLGDDTAGDRYKDIQLILNRYSMGPDPSYATAWFVTSQKGVWNWERYSDAAFDTLPALFVSLFQ